MNKFTIEDYLIYRFASAVGYVYWSMRDALLRWLKAWLG